MTTLYRQGLALGIEEGGGFGVDFFAEGGRREDPDAVAEAEDEEAGVFFALETDMECFPGFGEVLGC